MTEEETCKKCGEQRGWEEGGRYYRHVTLFRQEQCVVFSVEIEEAQRMHEDRMPWMTTSETGVKSYANSIRIEEVVA